MFVGDLEKIIQSGWLEVFTRLSSSLLKELGINLTKDQGGSWIKMISNFLLVFKIVLVSSLFFRTFCENSLILLKIISYYYSQKSKLTTF